MTNTPKVQVSKVLPEVVFFSANHFEDHRGKIWSSLTSELLQSLEPIFTGTFNHDKFVINKKGVLRGIHGDTKSWKLVTSVSGDFFQVVVDCRADSPRYLMHETFSLDQNAHTSVLIPPGFGNAFLSLSEKSVYHYKLSYQGEYNDFDNQFTFFWNNPVININWPINDPILSDRDKNA